jgi:cell division protein FtsB
MAIQKSNDSPREKWVKALLPAAVILMVYMIFFQIGSGRNLRQLSEDRESTRGSAVSEDQLSQLIQENLDLEKERDRLESEIESAEDFIKSKLEVFGKNNATIRLRKVVDLCQSHSISIQEQKSVIRVEASRLRQESVAKMDKLVQGGVGFQQLELFGRYADVQKLMKRLPDEIVGLIPVGLETIPQEQDKTKLNGEGQMGWRLYLLL